MVHDVIRCGVPLSAFSVMTCGLAILLRLKIGVVEWWLIRASHCRTRVRRPP